MKKATFIMLIVFSTIFMVGCEKLTKEEKVMKSYSKQYYEEYVKDNFKVNEINITIGQIRDVTTRLNASFDISKIESCTDDSYVNLKINASNGEIEKYTYNMNCSK